MQSIDSTANAETYQQRLQSCKAQWQKQIPLWEEQAQGLRGRKIMVQHKNWDYMLDWLGLESVADLEPKPGLPPTAGDNFLPFAPPSAKSALVGFFSCGFLQNVKSGAKPFDLLSTV